MTWENKIYFDVRRAVKEWMQCLLSHLNSKRPGCLRTDKEPPLKYQIPRGRSLFLVLSGALTDSLRRPPVRPCFDGKALRAACTCAYGGHGTVLGCYLFWSQNHTLICLSNECQILRAPESTNLLMHLFIYKSTTNLLMDLINHLCLLLIIW